MAYAPHKTVHTHPTAPRSSHEDVDDAVDFVTITDRATGGRSSSLLVEVCPELFSLRRVGILLVLVLALVLILFRTITSAG